MAADEFPANPVSRIRPRLPKRHRNSALSKADAQRQPRQPTAHDRNLPQLWHDWKSLRLAMNKWLHQLAAPSWINHDSSLGQSRDNSWPAKPARTLTTASCRVTE